MAELVTREEAQAWIDNLPEDTNLSEAMPSLYCTILDLYDRTAELEAALLQHPNLNLSAVLGYDAGRQESAARIAELEAENKRLREFAESVPGPVRFDSLGGEECRSGGNHDLEVPMQWHKPDCLYVRAQTALKGMKE